MSYERVKGIKYIALDVYGTILATDDPEDKMPMRTGTLDLLSDATMAGIQVVTTSDAPLETLLISLDEAFERIDRERQEYFFNHYCLPTIHHSKDFSLVARDLLISPSEILVIGDSIPNDIEGAKKHGCKYILVPEYVTCFEDSGDISDLLAMPETCCIDTNL